MTSILSVLCVSEDPLFLDRICRNLERSRDMFVETLVSVEDALHLTDYIFFDAVVTDCLSWQGEQNGFLKALRKQGKKIPFIYCIGGQDPFSTEEAPRCGRVRVLTWGERGATRPFDELVGCIREVTAPDPVENP